MYNSIILFTAWEIIQIKPPSGKITVYLIASVILQLNIGYTWGWNCLDAILGNEEPFEMVVILSVPDYVLV